MSTSELYQEAITTMMVNHLPKLRGQLRVKYAPRSRIIYHVKMVGRTIHCRTNINFNDPRDLEACKRAARSALELIEGRTSAARVFEETRPSRQRRA